MESNDLIAAYGRDPVGFHAMEDPTVSARQDNSVCGDFIEVFLDINDQGMIERFSYTGNPALHTLAAASLLAEYIIGCLVDEVLLRDYHQIVERGLQVSTRRRRAAISALLATKNAIHLWKQDGRIETYEDILDAVNN